MTGAREEALERGPFIHYPVRFKDTNKAQVPALINLGSEVNAIHPTFAKQLGLPIRPINVGAQKINGTTLDTYGMLVAAFSVEHKANWVRFFEETFLVTNVSPKVVLGMPFFTLSGTEVDFSGRELWWRTYTIKEVLPTTRCVELVGKKKFAAAALDPQHETYVVYVASLSSTPLVAFFDVHSFRRPQISGLIAEEASPKVPTEYSDFADVFFPDLASKLLKRTRINDHTIELIDGQQPPYRPIYSLGPVKLKTLKAYIETNLANGFIKPSKSSAGAPILFERKSDGSLWLCVDWRGLNNLMIENRYPFPLIKESLDRLERAKRFTQLNLTSAYYQIRIREADEWNIAFKTWYGHFEY